MGGLVCEELHSLLQKVSGIEWNMEQLSQIIGKSIPELAKLCQLCLVEVVLFSSENIAREKIIREQVLYRKDQKDFAGERKIIERNIVNGGRLRVVVAPQSGMEWNETRERDLDSLVGIIYLLCERVYGMKLLDRFVYTDMLTGVMNEASLMRYMGGLKARGMLDSYCGNFVNIKNMKLLNERYGDRLGNRIMMEYAKKIEKYLGEDGGICRLGGDNFIVCILQKREEEFLKFMKELVVEFTGTDGRSYSIRVNSRIGYYYVESKADIACVMRNISIALNQAGRGRNADVVKFEEKMMEQLFRMRELEEMIPRAIEQEDFVVFYQPKALIKDKSRYRLHGAEALVRWVQDGKIISPIEFVPILEKNGLVTKLDFYVLEHVCQNIKQWEAMGIEPVRVSTNFSRRHLWDKHFADKVEEIIRKYDVNPKYLEVEITESYDVKDIEALNNFVDRMHTLGVCLAMDDFGSGFASLRMLKDMVVDTIKLDKSIIDGVGGRDEEDEIIVANIIRMINQLGKEVIAEGVEVQSQADFLRENGCMMIQGYLYGKPMPESEFRQKLIEG